MVRRRSGRRWTFHGYTEVFCCCDDVVLWLLPKRILILLSAVGPAIQKSSERSIVDDRSLVERPKEMPQAAGEADTCINNSGELLKNSAVHISKCLIYAKNS
jgi:hypothetical protein